MDTTPIARIADPDSALQGALGAKHKYSKEEIMAEIARPKGKVGRPKKYKTDEEYKAARADYNRRKVQRARCVQLGIEIPPEMAARKHAIYSCDEERVEAHRVAVANHRSKHKDECNIRRAASRKLHSPSFA